MGLGAVHACTDSFIFPRLLKLHLAPWRGIERSVPFRRCHIMGFTVAIVGRPNVGKSTLFNRLVGRRLALVDDTPGVTRDRREGEAHLGDLTFTVVDTAGLEEAAVESLPGRMRLQSEAAMAQSDAVFFLVDVRTGVTPTDRALANLVRKSGKPTVLVANKSEGRGGEAAAREAYALGLG